MYLAKTRLSRFLAIKNLLNSSLHVYSRLFSYIALVPFSPIRCVEQPGNRFLLLEEQQEWTSTQKTPKTFNQEDPELPLPFLIPLAKVGSTKDSFPQTFAEHKMDVSSPLCPDDEYEVSLNEIFTKPSFTAIKVTHPLGPDRSNINLASLALFG